MKLKMLAMAVAVALQCGGPAHAAPPAAGAAAVKKLVTDHATIVLKMATANVTMINDPLTFAMVRATRIQYDRSGRKIGTMYFDIEYRIEVQLPPRGGRVAQFVIKSFYQRQIGK